MNTGIVCDHIVGFAPLIGSSEPYLFKASESGSRDIQGNTSAETELFNFCPRCGARLDLNSLLGAA